MASQELAKKLIYRHESNLKSIVGDEGRLKYLQEVYKNNLWLLSFYVLERNAEFRVNLMDDFAVKMCVAGQQDIDKMLFLVSRGHFKSTLLNMNNNIRRYLKYPQKTIGIGSDTFDRAKDFLNEIKQKIQYPELISLYPELFRKNKNKYKKFGDKEVVLPGHEMRADQTPTFMAFGIVDGGPVGKHFNYITIDDLVHDKNIFTPEQIMKVRNSVGKLTPLGKIDGSTITQFIGTTYDPHDAYAVMKTSDKYKKFIMPYFEVNEDGTLSDRPISRHGSRKQIMEWMADPLVGKRIVFAQYLLDPKSDDTMKLDISKIQQFSRLPDDRNFKAYISLDPAISEENTACENAISCVLVSEYREIFVDETYAERTSKSYRPSTILRQMFNYHKKYSKMFGKENVYLVFEGVAFQKSLKFFAEDMAKEVGYTVQIREAKPDKRKKSKRIFDNLEPTIESKSFYIRPEMNDLQIAIETFPYCVKYDLLDSVAQVNMVCRRPYKMKPIKHLKQPEILTEAYYLQQEAKQKAIQNYYIEQNGLTAYC